MACCRRKGARDIICVLPYLGYSQTPLGSFAQSDILQLLESVGASKVITFESGTVSNLRSSLVFKSSSVAQLAADWVSRNFERSSNLCIIAQNQQNIDLARSLRDLCRKRGVRADFAVVLQEKDQILLAGAIKHKVCLLIESLANSSEALVQSAEYLKANEASSVQAFVAHLNIQDPDDLSNLRILEKLITTDSIPLPPTCADELGNELV